jgi:hypothetical protein
VTTRARDVGIYRPRHRWSFGGGIVFREQQGHGGHKGHEDGTDKNAPANVMGRRREAGEAGETIG